VSEKGSIWCEAFIVNSENVHIASPSNYFRRMFVDNYYR